MFPDFRYGTIQINMAVESFVQIWECQFLFFLLQIAVWKVTVASEVSAASHTPDDDARSLSATFSCTIDRSVFE